MSSNSVSRSSSTPQGVILTPGEYEEYLRLTQAAKSFSIAYVAQIGNVYACLTYSCAPWILDTGASDHISGNSQTIAKGIDSTCPLPSLPLPLYFMFLIFLSILFRLES